MTDEIREARHDDEDAIFDVGSQKDLWRISKSARAKLGSQTDSCSNFSATR